MDASHPKTTADADAQMGQKSCVARDWWRSLLHHAIACVFPLLGSGTVFATETIRYLALTEDGTVGGHQIVTNGVEGLTRVEFIFKDNGRGPEYKEEFTLAPDGTLSRYELKGLSEFGAVVDETFVRENAQVRWRTPSDSGEKSEAAGSLYIPIGGAPTTLWGTPAVVSVAIAALARRSDGALPLIPSGTLHMRTLDRLDLDGRSVQLLALSGLGLAPTLVWVTGDASRRLVALLVPEEFQLIEEQFQSQLAVLQQRQRMAERHLIETLQSRLVHPILGSTLIRNARVFDSEHARLDQRSDVLIRDGKIVSVIRAGAGREADNVIEADGRVLLPGLFDMHTHITPWEAPLHLAAGITTVRDLGSDNTRLQQFIADERAGKLLSPHVVPAGFIEGEGPMSNRGGFVISDLQEAKRAIDWYAAHGYPQIKIYNSFPKAILGETAAYAHEKGLRVSGHVPAFMRAQEAVEQGFDEIQHINHVVLNFMVDDNTDTRTLERFRLPAEKTADLDLDGPEVRAFMALLLKNGTVLDPTLATFEFLHQRNGQMWPVLADIAEHLPPDVQRTRRTAEMHIPDDATGKRYKRSFDKMVELVGRAYRAGIPIVAGTDEMAGFTLQRELELYVQAGLTPAQALQIATWTAAKYARVLDDRGSVTSGKRADLVLVDGDPLSDILSIRKAALVLKDGTAYYPEEIHAALGIKPFGKPVRVVRRGNAQ